MKRNWERIGIIIQTMHVYFKAFKYFVSVYLENKSRPPPFLQIPLSMDNHFEQLVIYLKSFFLHNIYVVYVAVISAFTKIR